ncbi:MAG TPA: CvpA family protein [Gammaproteobacteria bacterium]|jgi:membrane protein required for colicin V production|nr:CvpA family protein [Gammaproteobacteria bacterium]
MNWFDYAIIFIFAMSAMVGMRRGLIKEVISLGSLVAAVVIAVMFSNHLAAVFTRSDVVQTVVSQTSSAIGTSTSQPVSYLALGTSFIILFMGTLVVGSIVGYIINVALPATVIGLSNRLLGGLFGLGRGFLIVLVMLFCMQLTPFARQAWWTQSEFVHMYQPAINWLGGVVSPTLNNLKSKLNDTIQGVGSQIQGLTNSLPQGF